MTLNRYRLRHLAGAKHKGAIRAQNLLKRPDRLIGLILLGNNFINILAASIATIIALRLYGEAGIAIATFLLTIVILVFSEVTPKTFAALHPERIAFPAAFIYTPLLWLFYPLVWVVNAIANGILKMFGVTPDDTSVNALGQEELRTVVLEAGAMIPKRHQNMLLNILDLENVTVEDIMIPRNDIAGIDLDDDWNVIEKQIMSSQFTRLPVFHGSIDHVIGFVHLRKLLPLLLSDEISKNDLEKMVKDTYFIPENTSLNRQLLNFQRKKRRVGLVVDEYGDVLGLATLEDILEEVVGEFTTDPSTHMPEYTAQKDGSFLVDGSASIRELNRNLSIELPTDGPKTLNGLVVEYMEDIPQPGTTVLLAGYPVEIVQTKDNLVKTLRIHPLKRQPVRTDEE